MKKFKRLVLLCGLMTFVVSCNFISEKRTEIVEKEKNFLSSFLNQTNKDIIKKFGEPNEIITENNKNYFVYKIKGKIFDCKRKFEIDKNNNIIGFESTCWE